MWFFYHFPSGHCSLVGYRRSLPNPSTMTLLLASPSCAFSIAIFFSLAHWHPEIFHHHQTNAIWRRSLHFSHLLVAIYKMFIAIKQRQFGEGVSFLPLGWMSKLFPMLPLSFINTTSLFMIFFISKHISLYVFRSSQ